MILRRRARAQADGAGSPAPRVVVATRVYAPEPVAAAFRQQALVKALIAGGAEVDVLTTKVPEGVQGQDGPGRVRRWPVKRDKQGHVRGYVSYLSFDLPLALRLLLRPRPDAIVLEPPPTTGAVGMVVSALRGVPYTFYAADVWSDATLSVEGVPPLVTAAVRWAETTVWRRAARVLTISPGVQQRLVDLTGDSLQYVMVGNGVDTDTFTTDGPTAGEQGPYFVYAGTVSEWQGADVFLEAFAAVRAEHPEARLLFFSEGTGRDRLAEQVRREGIEGVEFRPKIAPAEVSAHLRGAVAGLSSITPGQGYEFALPTKIYAATGSGAPVIHAGDGAAHDRIRENGLGWACRHDAGEVADAMRAALAGTDRPEPEHLRDWTLREASLEACAGRAARAVLSSIRPRPGR